MTETFSTANRKETAVLVALITQKESEAKVQEYLEELAFLAETSGARTVKRFTQRLEKPDVTFFVGKGKLDEIAAFVKEREVDMVIFDDDLTPSQVRNIERFLECKVLDRSLLILNIFSIRAKTAQAKSQVELAQYQYILPRLTKMWSHLSKQKGGIGMRGPGEKELETDRRIVRDKIALFNKKLEKIDRQSITRRKSRQKEVRVALVGYTNVGKSTLMQRLSKADVFAENQLFATVDSTVRKVVIGTVPFLLTDTVGFIRKLPHTLIECFKSTLDEVREADVLLHVVDVSHPSFEEQIEIVNHTLVEIGAADKPTILVFNKIDRLMHQENGHTSNGQQVAEHTEASEPAPMTLEQLENTYMSNGASAPGELAPQTTAIFISAEQNLNMDKLREMLYEKVADKYYSIYPNNTRQEYYG